MSLETDFNKFFVFLLILFRNKKNLLIKIYKKNIENAYK